MGRRAKAQGLQEKPEFRFRLFRTDAKEPQDLLLQTHLMDADASPSHLYPVQDQIVGLGSDPQRLFRQQAEILLQRRGEWVMHGYTPLFFRVVFQERKIDHPDQRIILLRDQPELLSEMETKVRE